MRLGMWTGKWNFCGSNAVYSTTLSLSCLKYILQQLKFIWNSQHTANVTDQNLKMSAKNSSAKRSGKVLYGVCQAPVIDGKDEALLCEGECGLWLWLHRGCASMPPSCYESLSTSDETFVCLCCSNYQLKKELVQLRTEFRAALELSTNGAHRKQISNLTDAENGKYAAKRNFVFYVLRVAQADL